nr:TIGR03086 family metal-binding protein [Nocardia transvalensis]
MKPACHTMIDLLASVSAEQLGRPTPCADYTVAGLIDHIAEVSLGFAELARGQATGPRPARPSDDLAAVADAVGTLGEAWADPVAWQGVSAPGGLPLPNETWGKIAFTEMVVHGWDLAAATGHPVDLPEETLRACLDHVAVFVPAAPVPELWGAAVEVPGDAPLLDRIVAVTGRDPHWTAA